MAKELTEAFNREQELHQELAYLKGILEGKNVHRCDGGDFKAPVDGTIRCGDIELHVKKGFTDKDMQALMDAGEKMLKWLEKKGIELDGTGSSENN